MTKLRLLLVPFPELCACHDLLSKVGPPFGPGKPLPAMVDSLQKVLDTAERWHRQVSRVAYTLTGAPDSNEALPFVATTIVTDAFFSQLELGIDARALFDWSATATFGRLVDELECAPRFGFDLRAYLGRRRTDVDAVKRLIARSQPVPEPAGFGSSDDGLVDWFCQATGLTFPCASDAVDRAYQRAAEQLDARIDDAKASHDLERLNRAYGRWHEISRQRST